MVIREFFYETAYYWVPLIALYTGMSLEEISQLHCADIIKDNEIIRFDINYRSPHEGVDKKRMKTKNAACIV